MHMQGSVLKRCGCIFLLLFCLSSATSFASTSPLSSSTPSAQDFPVVDPFYIYNQLDYLTSHFQHREAGYDHNLPPNINGHDEFTDYWSQEMLRNLAGFGAQVDRDSFPVQGWRGRPAPLPAFNVDLTIPGVSHPDQIVIIGCHYDGEAVSTDSAYDDASGCAIELGVARAMALYWQSHHIYPARTLRFILFDAEEQGILGSFHYVNETSNGDLQNITAMFNEEQSGMAYPVRYLGQSASPQMPLYVDMTPIQHTALKGALLTRSQQFHTLMQQAVPEVFARFRSLGYLGLTYFNAQKQKVTQDIFTPEQQSLVHVEDDQIGSSDQVPFTEAGLPCATFVGNSTYYDQNPIPGSYPYDQKADTLKLLNTYAQGGPQRSNALVLALALPGMLTTWMLHQPAVLGEAAASSGPIFALRAIAQTRVGQTITLAALSAFAPQAPGSSFTYTWNFGDGSTASGIQVSHVYKKSEDYTLTVQAHSSSGTTQLQKVLHLVNQPPSYQNEYATYQPTGSPRTNPLVHYPTPDPALSDTLSGPAAANVPTPIPLKPENTSKQATAHPPEQQGIILWLVGIGALIILLGASGLLFLRRKR